MYKRFKKNKYFSSFYSYCRTNALKSFHNLKCFHAIRFFSLFQIGHLAGHDANNWMEPIKMPTNENNALFDDNK